MTYPWKCFCLNILASVSATALMVALALLLWMGLFPDWKPNDFQLGAISAVLCMWVGNLLWDVLKATRNLIKRLDITLQ